MILKERLDRLKKCIALELGAEIDKLKFSMENGAIMIEPSNRFEKNLTDTWMKDYIIDWNWVGQRSSERKALRDDILEADAIVNFDKYYASKKGIKKFNL